jgi:hypothetical protein
MTANGRIRPLWLILFLILPVFLASGCSDSEENSGLSLVDQNGNHPASFLSVHPAYAVPVAEECRECHGSDLTGGISRQSCFLAECHHGTVPGWVAAPPAAQPHGDSAKKAPGSSGFVACQICHAADYSGGGAQVTCLSASCHGGPGTTAHPSQWRTGDTYLHSTTDEANASACAQCHLNGNSSPIGAPSPPAPAGTPPGCYNSTLCHSENPVPHPLDNAWVTTPPAAQPHGNSAKAAPGASSGFAYCQVCHGAGTDFAGGPTGVSCYPCHGTSAPHPSQWRTGDTYVHTSADEGNASVCAYCHTGGANSPLPTPPAPPPGTQPGCFNNTLCHEAGIPHPVGGSWVTTPPAAQPHGNDAKAAPGSGSGFLYCQACHGSGSNFAGGSSGVSCYPCHAGLGINPHPANWRTGDTYVHTNVDEGNAAVCAYCHTGGSISPIPPPPAPPPGTQTGCFNGTLCHADVVPAGTHATGWLDASSASFHSAPVGVVNCFTCHPISGHPDCTTCHFDSGGSRDYAPLGFTHNASVLTDHREGALASAAGTICENCHQTSRTFRAGFPLSCQGGGQDHPNNDGCHYDATLLDPVLTNPRY